MTYTQLGILCTTISAAAGYLFGAVAWAIFVLFTIWADR